MVPIRTFNELAATVRARRRELGWSQQALADAAGVSRSWIARFETGRSSSEVALLMRVLDALSLEMHLGVAVADETSESWDLDDLMRDLSTP